jgi:hypothetical protein
MRKRTPAPGARPQQSLPHDHDRERGQPYATELEDYSHGVPPPPAGEADPRTTRARARK